MAIRTDSYSSVDDVTALTRHLLDGADGFGGDTRPTLDEVESFIDEASGTLNMAFRSAGFDPADVRANSTAKLPADAWVRGMAATVVELTQRGAGWNDDENTRTGFLAGLYGDAMELVERMQKGLKREGITVTDPAHQGLTYTAFDKHSQRSDPDSTTLEQPQFRRGQFDSP
jgi:hypothetical protein